MSISAGRFVKGQPDGIDLGDLTVYGAKDGKWYEPGKQGVGTVPTRVKGRVKVVGADGSVHTDEIDRAWIAKNIPVVNGGKPLPPRRALPAMEDVVSVHDDAPGKMVDLAPVMCVGSGRYVFFADKPRRVRFRGRQIILFKHLPPDASPVKVVGLGGKEKGRTWNVPRPGLESAEFAFEAPAAGFYALKVPCSARRFALEASDAPVALDLSEQDCDFAPVGGASVSLPFEVPEAGGFALVLSGDSYYRFAATLRDPDGRRRFEDASVDQVVVHSEDAVADPGFWTLELSKADRPHYDVINLDLLGINGTVFLSDRKMWSCAGRIRPETKAGK